MQLLHAQSHKLSDWKHCNDFFSVLLIFDVDETSNMHEYSEIIRIGYNPNT